VGLVIRVYKKQIPRGHRKIYIHGRNEISENLYQENIDGNVEVADDLIIRIEESRKEKLNKTMTSLDFRHSNRESWSLLKKLGQ